MDFYDEKNNNRVHYLKLNVPNSFLNKTLEGKPYLVLNDKMYIIVCILK